MVNIRPNCSAQDTSPLITTLLVAIKIIADCVPDIHASINNFPLLQYFNQVQVNKFCFAEFQQFSGGCRRGRDLKLILSCVDLFYNRNLAMPISTMQARAHLVLTSGNFQWRSQQNANVLFCVFRTSLRILPDMLAALLVVCSIETIKKATTHPLF